MLSKYSSAVGGVTRIFMSASQTEMYTLSVVSVLISGKLTDGCMHSRPLAVKRSEFVKPIMTMTTRAMKVLAQYLPYLPVRVNT